MRRQNRLRESGAGGAGLGHICHGKLCQCANEKKKNCRGVGSSHLGVCVSQVSV